MKANSGLKKNRTKIQMVLTALVILWRDQCLLCKNSRLGYYFTYY